ncbi:MAG TPA: PTS sugar transporter subunit IIC [Anaeromyxobacteraceae bacterium]|nr:PTS sugar transporter subunit IIC [Anaeromyxobacteraceae bacterium]
MDYLLLALVAGLAAVERKGFLQAMLSRPVALAPVAGLALGDLHGGLVLGPPLELLWLGAVNLGAALPPHETLGAAAVTGGAVLAGRALGTGVTPAVACLTLALVAALAVLGRRTDSLIEEWNVRLAARAEALLEEGSPRAALRANLRGLLLPFAASFALAPLAAAVAAFAVPAALHRFPGARPPLAAGWAALCGFAAAAGARAFRAQRGFGLFAVSFALCAVAARLAGVWR